MEKIESNSDKDQKNRAWETVEYTDNPDLPDIEQIEIVKDFLPPPELLVKRDPETEKVTMVLDKETVNFFREKANELNVSYQRMIRNLLNEYVARHSR